MEPYRANKMYYTAPLLFSRVKCLLRCAFRCATFSSAELTLLDYTPPPHLVPSCFLNSAETSRTKTFPVTWKGAKGIPTKGIRQKVLKVVNFRLFSGCFQVVFRLFSGCFQGVFSVFSGYFRDFQGVVRVFFPMPFPVCLLDPSK